MTRMEVAVLLGWLAAHAAQDLHSMAPGEVMPPLEALAELAAEATPRMARLERQVQRLEQREAQLGRTLPRRWSVLFDRYLLAVDEAGPRAPLAHTRLGWLCLQQDPQWATFQWVEALEEAPVGPHADWARLGLGGLLFDQGDFERAAWHFDQVVQGGGLLAPFAALQRGQLSWSRGDFEQAVDDLVYAVQQGSGALRDEAVAELAATVVAGDDLAVGALFQRACEGDEACSDRAWAQWSRARQTLGFHD